MRKYSLFLLIGALAMNCSQNNEPIIASLESLYEYERSEYTLAKERLENTIMEFSATENNKAISVKLQRLDSILLKTTVDVDKSISEEDIQQALANWESELIPMTNFEFPMAKIEPQRANVFKQLAKLRIQKDAKKMVEFLSLMEGASTIRFDSLRLVVVPEVSTVKVGEKYRANIYYCATSSTAEEYVDLLVNDLPVVFENGVGYIQFIPTRTGTSSYSVKTKSLRNFNNKEDLELETTVNYNVE